MNGINLGKLLGVGGVTWGSIRTVSKLHEGMDIAVSLPSPVPQYHTAHTKCSNNIFTWMDGRKEERKGEGLLSVCLRFLTYKMKIKNSPSLIKSW